MVFQSFALMPWLTVQAQRRARPRRPRRPARASARARPERDRHDRSRRLRIRLPQRAFGRHAPTGRLRPRPRRSSPTLLLMDEPFSALDVLTAENLRTELVDLWATRSFPTKAICIVTHNIEEAVLLADRVVVLGANPGRIVERGTRRPRPATGPAHSRVRDAGRPALRAAHRPGNRGSRPGTNRCHPDRPAPATLPRSAGLPASSRSSTPTAAASGSPDLADELNFEIDDLLPLVDAAAMLGLVTISDGELTLTDIGGRVHHRRHPNEQADLRRAGPQPSAAGAHHL